jgi:hypothetical protein
VRQVRSLAWWGPERLVLNGSEGWEVRSFPGGAICSSGQGLGVPHPEGRRWAVAMPDAVELDGVVHPLPGPVPPRAAGWWRDGLCVARTRPPGEPSRSELWWVRASGGAVPLLRGERDRLLGLTVTEDRLFVQVYSDADRRSPHQVRILEVEAPGDVNDAVPGLSGSVHQVLPTPAGRVAVWSEDPNFSQHLLLERGDGWEDVAPGLRVAGLALRTDSEELVMPAYDGIRAGLAVVEPKRRTWRWRVNEPAASLLPVALRRDGTLAAIRRPADGVPALVCVDGDATRDVVPLCRRSRGNVAARTDGRVGRRRAAVTRAAHPPSGSRGGP